MEGLLVPTGELVGIMFRIAMMGSAGNPADRYTFLPGGSMMEPAAAGWKE